MVLLSHRNKGREKIYLDNHGVHLLKMLNSWSFQGL